VIRDLTTRLRSRATTAPEPLDRLLTEAAREIERVTAERDRLLEAAVTPERWPGWWRAKIGNRVGLQIFGTKEEAMEDARRMVGIETAAVDTNTSTN
jgi:hypothetical protein